MTLKNFLLKYYHELSNIHLIILRECESIDCALHINLISSDIFTKSNIFKEYIDLQVLTISPSITDTEEFSFGLLIYLKNWGV